jgi:hypothetical protein
MSRFKKQVVSCKGSTVKGRFNAMDKQDKASARLLALAKGTPTIQPLSLQAQLNVKTTSVETLNLEETPRFVSSSLHWTPNNSVRLA